MSQKTVMLIALLLAGLLVVTLVSISRLHAKSNALRDAADNLERCGQLAADILKARRAPTRAVAKPSSSMEITKQIEDAARSANLPQNAVMVIEPQPPRRVADSPYKLRITHLDLKPLLLSDVVALLHHILKTDPTLVVTSLRLSSPTRGTDTSAATEVWVPEVTLTNLIYDPTTPLPSK